jgi:F-type H+-transporting ATPase subunit a
MMNAVFEQLAEALTYLGKKQIITLQLGNLSIQFDKAAMIMSWIVIGLLTILALFLRRALRQDIEDTPNRAQAALDILIDLLQGQLTSSFASEKLAIKMFPFISTLFLFVLFSNWLGIVPGLSSPTQNLNITMGLALMVFAVSQILAIRAKGMKAYWKGYLEPMPFMLPLNIVGELSKPMSHGFRLFGNVLAGTILITVVMAKFAPILVPSGLHLIFGLFFGGIQAFVFAILAVAYINVAVES